MKHDELRSIARNISESVTSGCGLIIGVYQVDVFGEAKSSTEGFIEIDFLNGTTHGGKPSSSLSDAVRLYKEALPGLCEKHGTTVYSFRQLTAKYWPDLRLGGFFTVTTEDAKRHRSTTEYAGISGARVKVQDNLGRLRPKHLTK